MSTPVPDLSGELRLTVSAVARRLGIAPATLRTWDRRYGLGPSDHASGRHRRYAPEDVARLETMQAALVRGAAPAEAARYALQESRRDSGDGVAVGAAVGAAESEPAPLPKRGRPGVGATVLRMPGASRHAQGLGRAVLALDARAVQGLVLDSMETFGVQNTWEELIRPVMGALSRRWETTGTGIELEHLLSESVTSVMSRAVVEAPPPITARPVLLGSMPGERHSLPLRVLAAALAQRAVGTNLLGADLPVVALAAAIGRVAPVAVFLWAQSPASADVDALRGLPRSRPRTRCYVGGPGWAAAELPAGIVALGSLAEADSVLAAAATG